MYSLVPLLALAGLACGPTDIGGRDAGGGVDGASASDAPVADDVDAPVLPGVDAPVYDSVNVYADGNSDRDACSAAQCPSEVPMGCGATEIPGNGLDDNCDGQVDEIGTCTPGAVQPCFRGPPGRRGVGACTDGTQRCEGSVEFGSWGPCEGGIWPGAEVCDSVDNDCNGCTDDDPGCCAVDLMCPESSSLPEASPFTDYVVDGTSFWGGAATSWSWTVVGGPCDQLLWASSGRVSYTLNGANTTSVTTPQVTFRPTLSGDYTFTMTVQTPDGVKTCTFVVHVRGPGMRVELCWDTTGLTGADIDLHLHKPGSTSDWFTTDFANNQINADDCYYYNCRAPEWGPMLSMACLMAGSASGSAPEWSYASSAVAECSGTPLGACWSDIGSCHNPRLDVDNISDVGIPENINVDNPHNADTFRVMVHYYDGSVATHPMVNVYCGGYLLGTYGAAPDQVAGFASGGGWGLGPMWRVVDVTTQVDGAGNTTGCTLAPLHPPATPASGYWITTDDRSY